MRSRRIAEQAAALVEGGVDLIIIETQTDLLEMEQALGAAREGAPGIAVAVSAAFTRDDRTLLGSSPVQVAERADRARRGRDRRELRRGAGAAAPRDAAHAAGRRSRSARRAPERRRSHAGRRAVRVPGDARVPGGARTGASSTKGCRSSVGVAGPGPLTRGRSRGASSARTPVAGDGRHRGRAPARGGPRPGGETAGTVLRRSWRGAIRRRGGDGAAPRRSPSGRWSGGGGDARRGGRGRDRRLGQSDGEDANERLGGMSSDPGAGIETVLHFPTRGRNLLRLQGDLLGAPRSASGTCSCASATR